MAACSYRPPRDVLAAGELELKLRELLDSGFFDQDPELEIIAQSLFNSQRKFAKLFDAWTQTAKTPLNAIVGAAWLARIVIGIQLLEVGALPILMLPLTVAGLGYTIYNLGRNFYKGRQRGYWLQVLNDSQYILNTAPEKEKIKFSKAFLQKKKNHLAHVHSEEDLAKKLETQAARKLVEHNPNIAVGLLLSRLQSEDAIKSLSALCFLRQLNVMPERTLRALTVVAPEAQMAAGVYMVGRLNAQ